MPIRFEDLNPELIKLLGDPRGEFANKTRRIPPPQEAPYTPHPRPSPMEALMDPITEMQAATPAPVSEPVAETIAPQAAMGGMDPMMMMLMSGMGQRDPATEKARLTAVEEQKASIAQTEDILRKMLQRGKGQIDLTPLMELSDLWTGSKFAPGYQKPLDEYKTAQISDLITKRKGDLVKMLEGAGAGPLNPRDLINLMGQKGRQGRFELDRELRATKDVHDYFDKMVTGPKGLTATAETLNNLEYGLSQNTLGTLGPSLGKAARIIGGEVGVLTDRDINRMIPAAFGREVAGLFAWIMDDPSQPLSPKITAELRRLVTKAKENLAVKYNQNIGQYVESRRTAPIYKKVLEPNAPGDLAIKHMRKIVKENFGEYEEIGRAKKAPQGPGGAMNFEQWKAQRGK